MTIKIKLKVASHLFPHLTVDKWYILYPCSDCAGFVINDIHEPDFLTRNQYKFYFDTQE